ncbi:MAG: hypothetical protein H0V70_28440 [Ktedonobacteraceae bacterium]|nr:hypothetical protein [Ktedonobacteraceae bacterium]
MPKDREKYRYIDVGLERGSWTLAMFEEDAKRHQMSEQPGKLITVRLTEYYERKKEWEMPTSREMLSGDDGRLPIPSSSQQDRTDEHAQELENNVLEISHYTTENADEAANYWASV